MPEPSGPRFWAVVPAAGKGARMGAPLPKQYLELEGRTILEHTLQRLLCHRGLAGVTLVIAPDDELWPGLAPRLPALRVVTGGAERCHSVLNALRSLASELGPDDWVLVHDAARPCVRATDISGLLTLAGEGDVGGILAVAVRDTLKRADAAGFVTETVDRNQVWHALTPQMFRHAELHHALEAALTAGRLVTDEAQAIEQAGGRVRLVEGSADNIKITRPEDLHLAACFLRAQAEENHG
jgi:2-C-methyl-D-erythritol 4-phosphate cytidylyltransferase